jgi:hypothetical protein
MLWSGRAALRTPLVRVHDARKLRLKRTSRHGDRPNRWDVRRHERRREAVREWHAAMREDGLLQWGFAERGHESCSSTRRLRRRRTADFKLNAKLRAAMFERCFLHKQKPKISASRSEIHGLPGLPRLPDLREAIEQRAQLWP